MQKRKQQRLVLIGISRKGEKSFKTLLKADPKSELPAISPPNLLSNPDKNQPCEFCAAEL